MLMRYCVTIDVVGPVDDDKLLALVSSTVNGATVFFRGEHKTVQVFGQWREMLRATALAAKIARATGVPAVFAVAQKGVGEIHNIVSDGLGALYDVTPYNLLSRAEFKDVRTAAMAPRTDMIRLFTEAKPNLGDIAAPFGAHVLLNGDGENRALGVWQGSVEKTAIIDIYGLSRAHLRAARTLARKIITENNQSAVLMAVIRKDGRAYARLIEKGGDVA